MGSSLCGSQGTQYLCNNRHIMQYLSLAQNPQDILNQTVQVNRICIQCNKNVEQCSSKVCWGCQSCKFYYCCKCKGYKVDQCPKKHLLKKKTNYLSRDDPFCDVCMDPINQKALHCDKCLFNLCQNCQNKKLNNKKK